MSDIATETLNGASTASSACRQPEWHVPQPQKGRDDLKVFNSMTRSVVPFIPAEGNLIRWYSCGPTVYDSAHIGHARNYMTFDIIRRILKDYFNYDISYVMNITDIDDKIILRARQGHLVREFGKKYPVDCGEMRGELEIVWAAFVKSKLGFEGSVAEWEDFSAKLAVELDSNRGNFTEADAKKLTAFEAAKFCRTQLNSAGLVIVPGSLTTGPFADILAPWLDAQYGSTITDQKIYRDLAAFWEADFLEDMASLNVLPADYMTRVSEYVPEIITYVEKIMENGFAYASEGSVYFDVGAFDRDPQHQYAKLCPWSAGNSKFFEEGEGSLGVKLGGKRDGRDFALWKCSKPGEPFWPSPWGNGRPGWHIECSAMASAVLPEQLDIHSGGIDLAFPHHDNEIAQAEAHFHSRQWVNYFLHAGHVHIEGLKMSKSLKNFISIKEALKKFSARQLRFLFLQHTWSSTLIYKESSMQAAVAIDSTFTNFFANVLATIRDQSGVREDKFTALGYLANDHGVEEKALLVALDKTRHIVHEALCDSFDTPRALSALLELISTTNIYMKRNEACVSVQSLKHIHSYVEKMYKTFGLSSQESGKTEASSGVSVDIMAILKEVAVFRDSVRSGALAASTETSRADILRSCDELRKNLSGQGVVFEDRSGSSLVKLVDPAEIARELKAAAEREAEAQARRLETLRLQEEKAAAKAKKASIPPSELFRDNAAYSQFDEQGIPTHDSTGLELSKNARKKCVKEYEAQEVLYNKSKQ